MPLPLETAVEGLTACFLEQLFLLRVSSYVLLFPSLKLNCFAIQAPPVRAPRHLPPRFATAATSFPPTPASPDSAPAPRPNDND